MGMVAAAKGVLGASGPSRSFCSRSAPRLQRCMGLGRCGPAWVNAPACPAPPRPLHIAARNGLAAVVQALLSRGATVLAVDEEGACAPWVLGGFSGGSPMGPGCS